MDITTQWIQANVRTAQKVASIYYNGALKTVRPNSDKTISELSDDI